MVDVHPPSVFPRPRATRRDESVVLGAQCVRVGSSQVGMLAGFLWARADGSRTVGDLAHAAERELRCEIPRGDVWLALDELADAGLLAERLTPPAAGGSQLTRRELLGLASAALAVLTTSLPAAVHGDDLEARTVDDLTQTEQRALREARAARSRGDAAAAEEWSSRAKQARRERVELERTSEQNTKADRAELIENAEQGPAPATPTPANRPGRPSSLDSPSADAPGMADLETGRGDPREAPGERENRYQEQELKKTQERNVKRLNEP